ncbi:MAG: hypothetical protein QXJ62_04130 [Nitrososphaeria archaeon]
MEAPRFIRRSAYTLVGGWNEGAGALDDWDLTTRLRAHNLRVGYIGSKYILHNEGRLTLKSLFIKKYRMGKTVNLARYLSHQKLSIVGYQLTPLRILLLKRVVFFTKRPIYILGVLIMKLIEAIGLAIGSCM